MANTCVQSLFVLTLLQLCRAEISDKLPEWYSANVINDGYQPKSISEIFSTDSPFSSTNPIVVLPKLTSTPDKILSSTLSSTLPPSSFAVEDFKRTSILPSSTPIPPTFSTIPPQVSTEFSSVFPSQPPQVEITQFTEQTNPPSQSLFETQPETRPTTFLTSTPLPDLNQQTTLEQAPPSSSTGRFVVPIQSEFPSTQQSTTPRPLPNYFVIYQQAPQTFQGLPGQGPSLQGGLFGDRGPQQSSTAGQQSSTVVIQPTPTATPLTSQISSSSPLPITSEGSTPRTTSRRSTPISTSPKLTTPAPTTPFIQQFGCVNATSKIGALPIQIRVVAPRGSITHVNINPAVTLTTTTMKPTRTRTRKTPKPKKNTYDACLCGCKTRREPICAIPMSATWVDPEKLKGFPSVCHMACFNSYKKEPYEKILDGRCGRLRTRIETFDSKTKLKREELNKAQYSIDNGDHTIVEIAALHHK